MTIRDLSTGYLPIVAVVGIMAGVFWLGFGYSKLISTDDTTDNRISQITKALEEQKSAIKELTTQVFELKHSMNSLPADALRQRDFAIMMAGFCLRFERMNKGIRCPAEM
jgi:hypothetical protein